MVGEERSKLQAANVVAGESAAGCSLWDQSEDTRWLIGKKIEFITFLKYMNNYMVSNSKQRLIYVSNLSQWSILL